MTSDTTTEILALGKRWAEAEQSADTAVLDDIAVDEFRLVGPLGFVLDKGQWLEQAYPAGRIPARSADGQFRITHIFVCGADSGWRIANIQLSQLAGPTN